MTVLVLRSSDFATEEQHLLQALRIYTRDIDCRVQVSGRAIPLSDSAALETIARQARAESAELAVWANRRMDGTPVYFLLSVRDLDLRETEIAPLGSERAALAVAMKVRTLLSQRASGDAAAPGTGIAPSPSPSRATADAGPRPPPVPAVDDATRRAGATLPPTVPLTGPPRSLAPPSIRAVSPEAAPWSAGRLGLGAAYGVVSPLDPTWLQQGVWFSAALRVGHDDVHLVADVAILAAANATIQGFATRLRDLPLGLGLRRRWQLPGVMLAAGPRLGLHAFQASATSTDGRSGWSRRLSGSLGAIAELTLPLGPHIAARGGLSLEGLIPIQKFTVTGQEVLNTGPLLFGANVGLELSFP